MEPSRNFASRPLRWLRLARAVVRSSAIQLIRPRITVVSLVLVWAAMTGGLGWFLAASQSSTESSITQRLQARSEAGADSATQEGSTGAFAWLAVGAFALVGLLAITLVARLIASRQRLVVLNAELERIAHLDALTGVKNRRALEETLDATLSAARRHQQDMSVLLIDIDHFKWLNDAVGHRNGDVVLRQVAQTLQAALRTEDLIGRWGGEEFLLILPDTDDHDANWVAERLRLLVSELRANFGHDTRALTVTIGVAQWAGESAEDLLERADAALYAGKADGRNIVSVAGPAHEEPLNHLVAMP